jgi:predicted Zn-dependent protease
VDRRAWAGLALADLCAADGRHDEALTLYRQAAGPTTSALPRGAALIRRGSLLAQLDRGAEAEAELRAALVLDPENVRAHYLLAQILSRRGDPAARAEAAKEQRIHGLLRELRDHLSTLYVKDTARRTRLWRELAAAWPENRLLLHSLVRDQLEGGDWGGAHATCAELRQRDGDSAALCWFEARAAAGGGDLAAAKRFADAMERLDPKVPSSVLRTILDDWRRGNPETVDGARYERTVREWLAGR